MWMRETFFSPLPPSCPPNNELEELECNTTNGACAVKKRASFSAWKGKVLRSEKVKFVDRVLISNSKWPLHAYRIKAKECILQVVLPDATF